MSTHLKGPWRIVERETLDDGSVYPRHIATKDGSYQICLLESPSMAALGYDRTPHEQERDLLIAAAPELLAALQALVAYDSHQTEYDGRVLSICPDCGKQDGEHTGQCEFVLARAAIAKATGSAP